MAADPGRLTLPPILPPRGVCSSLPAVCRQFATMLQLRRRHSRARFCSSSLVQLVIQNLMLALSPALASGSTSLLIAASSTEGRRPMGISSHSI